MIYWSRMFMISEPSRKKNVNRKSTGDFKTAEKKPTHSLFDMANNFHLID